MKGKKWIGVDIHKKQITVCILNKDGSREEKVYERTKEGIEEFLENVDNETVIGVESTTWTRDFAIRCIKKAKDVIIFNTIELSKLMSKVKKTDKVDTGCMALIIRKFKKEELSLCALKSKECAEIKGLLKIRDSLVKKKIVTKNEIISMLDYWGCYRSNKYKFNETDRIWIKEREELPESIKKEILKLFDLIKEYENVIKEIEKEIDCKLEENEDFNRIIKIKGIGKICGAYIISKIGNIDRFENYKKLISYFGLAPKVITSDEKGYNGKITKNTDKDLLRVLIQAAWINIRYDKVNREFYNKLKSRSCKQKAIVAVARKLVISVYFTLKGVNDIKK